MAATWPRGASDFRKLGQRVGQVRKGADYMRDVLGIEYPLALEDLRTAVCHTLRWYEGLKRAA